MDIYVVMYWVYMYNMRCSTYKQTKDKETHSITSIMSAAEQGSEAGAC